MNKKYKIILILGIFILITFCSGLTYSFFHSSLKSTSTDQHISKFVFKAETKETINLPLLDLNPGDILEYPFSISNSELDIVSNVTIEYQLTLKTFHLVPLTIELFKVGSNNTETLLMTCDESFSRNIDNELICNAPLQSMIYGSPTNDNYKIKVTFPKQYNNEIYANLVDYINIEIRSWQKIE
ncbi:MAG: hypothetical protein RSH78_01625 [Bacilli bacterium]